MRVKSVAYAAAIVAGSLAPVAASAATVAVATTDLNVRSGPGPSYAILGAIAMNGQATINACIQGSHWCRVSYRGQPGWVYTEYMRPTGRRVVERTTTVTTERPAVVTQAATEFDVPAIQYEQEETVGAAPPVDISGDIAAPAAAVAEPAGTVVASDEATIVPPAAVRTYVVDHPLDPVYLNGEVVVGAGLPPSVALQPVPDYDYDYAYVNQQPVLVQPDTRRIVYVYR